MSTHYAGTKTQIQALDAFIKLMRAVDSVGHRVESKKTTGSLSGTQFGTLEMLYHLGPLYQNEIGEKLLISKSNVVAVVDKLEQQDLVYRQRSEEDRRHIYVHLTEAGQTLVSVLLPGHVAAITEAMNYLNAAELAELGHLCRKLGLGEPT